MSDMEIFYGSYKKSDKDIIPTDEDEFYDLEHQHECLYVMVDNQLYEVKEIEQIDPFGFTLRIPPSEESRFIAYWYNGGAGIHEVIHDIIKGSTHD